MFSAVKLIRVPILHDFPDQDSDRWLFSCIVSSGHRQMGKSKIPPWGSEMEERSGRGQMPVLRTFDSNFLIRL